MAKLTEILKDGGIAFNDGRRLSLGDECTLEEPEEHGATARYAHQELLSEEIREALESGKYVTRLALNKDEHVAFTLGDDLVLRKVRLLDAVLEKLDDESRDSLTDEFLARFALLSGEIGQVFDLLDQWLKFISPEDEQPAKK